MDSFQATVERMLKDIADNAPDDTPDVSATAQKVEAAKRRFIEAIPKIYRKAKIADFAAIRGISEWISNPDGFLYINGPCGCGKTHLSYAMAIEFARSWVEAADFSGPFVESIPQLRYNATSIFREVVEAIRADRDTGLIGKLKTSKLPLIFDDIGSEKPTDFVRSTWFEIIDERYSWGYPTVFISNLNISQIADALTDRVASRISSGKVVVMGGKDRRVEK
jgi:DNA replication protein DnaC